MKLTRKFTFALVSGVLVVQAGFGVVRVRREQALFQLDIAREENILGRSLALSAEKLARTSGVEEARALVARADLEGSHVDIRWIDVSGPETAAHTARVSREALAPLLEGKQVSAQTEDEDAAVYTYAPVRLPDGRTAAIEISDPLHDEREYMAESVRNAVLSTALLVGLCGLVAWLLGLIFIGRPVRRLVKHARQIGEGELAGRVTLQQRDELSDLANEMNLMAEALERARARIDTETRAKIAALEQLKHADRLRTVGTLASGIAHELGTPLNVVEGHAQLILEDQTAGVEARDNAIIIKRQSKRMTRIIRQVLDFARREHGGEGVADAGGVARRVLDMVAPLAKKRNVTLKLESEAETSAAIPEGELEQVLTNVVMNAIQAMPDGGDVQLDVARAHAAPTWTDEAARDMVRLVVRDEGRGMNAETVERLFEPFFTTKGVGEGTGLGLSVAYGIVAERDGWIAVTSEPGRGSEFSIFVPEAVAP